MNFSPIIFIGFVNVAIVSNNIHHQHHDINITGNTCCKISKIYAKECINLAMGNLHVEDFEQLHYQYASLL